jgi:hypothetical protein
LGKDGNAGKPLAKRMQLEYYENIVMDLDQAKCAVFVQQNPADRTVLAKGEVPCCLSALAGTQLSEPR